MAGEVLSPQAQQVAQSQQPDLVGNFKQGFDLAQRAAATEFKREALNQRQQEIGLQRDQFNSTLLGSFMKGVKAMEGRSPKAQQAIMDSILKPTLKRAGFDLGDIAAADLTAKDPTIRASLDSIGKRIAQGGLGAKERSGLMVQLGQVLSKDGGAQFVPTVTALMKQLEGETTQARALEKTEVQTEQQKEIVEARGVEERASLAVAQTFKQGQQEREQEFRAGLQEADISSREKIGLLKLAQQRETEAKKAVAASEKKEFEKAKFGKDLRADLSKSKPFNQYAEVRNNARNALKALRKKTPFGDTSAMVDFIHIMDPGSAVRESEGKLVLKTGSIFSRFANIWNAGVEGKKFTDAQRADLMGTIEEAWVSRMDTYSQFRATTMEEAQRLGLVNVDPGSKLIEEDTKFLSNRGKKETAPEQTPERAGVRGAVRKTAARKPKKLSSEQFNKLSNNIGLMQQKIKDLRNQGVSPQQIAILERNLNVLRARRDARRN